MPTRPMIAECPEFKLFFLSHFLKATRHKEGIIQGLSCFGLLVFHHVFNGAIIYLLDILAWYENLLRPIIADCPELIFWRLPATKRELLRHTRRPCLFIMYLLIYFLDILAWYKNFYILYFDVRILDFWFNYLFLKVFYHPCFVCQILRGLVNFIIIILLRCWLRLIEYISSKV